MPLFRKRPVVIEAYLYDGTLQAATRIFEWSDGIASPGRDGMEIDTLEGVMHASEGDWIVRGVNGEFYPVKPQIFEKTYEPA